MDNPSAVRIIGPLTTHVEGFCAYLAERGYPPESASLQLRLMAQLSRWLDAGGLEVTDLTPARVECFLVDRRAAGYTYLLSSRAPAQLTAYLRGVGAISSSMTILAPSEVLVGEYRRHLAVERGLAPSTVSAYTTLAENVLRWWSNPNADGLAGVSAADVRSLTLERCRGSSLPAAKAFITAFRSWLRF
jgi:integrase/recombinase XerD